MANEQSQLPILLDNSLEFANFPKLSVGAYVYIRVNVVILKPDEGRVQVKSWKLAAPDQSQRISLQG